MQEVKKLKASLSKPLVTARTTRAGGVGGGAHIAKSSPDFQSIRGNERPGGAAAGGALDGDHDSGALFGDGERPCYVAVTLNDDAQRAQPTRPGASLEGASAESPPPR